MVGVATDRGTAIALLRSWMRERRKRPSRPAPISRKVTERQDDGSLLFRLTLVNVGHCVNLVPDDSAEIGYSDVGFLQYYAFFGDCVHRLLLDWSCRV